MQRDPTREDNTLDLLCTNKPSLVKNIVTLPGISDHDAIIADSDIKPAHNKKNPRNIPVFSKADWTSMKCETNIFSADFLASYKNQSVDCNWTSIKAFINEIMSKYIPTKKTSRLAHSPWISHNHRQKSRHKQRLYNQKELQDMQKT